MAQAHATFPRLFGSAAQDLEFDFASQDRPALVTALLAHCAAPADATFWWRQTVGARSAALLALLRATDVAQAITTGLRCVFADCSERFEIDLPHALLDALPGAEPPLGDAIELQRTAAPPLLLRRPTGEDLRSWREQPPADAANARTAMLNQLLLSGPLRPEDVEPATRALANADPLVAFSVRCACPVCGHEAERDIDLEGLALARLAALQRTLLQELHLLAAHYGWTEGEILAVAPARRARYREMIEGVMA